MSLILRVMPARFPRVLLAATTWGEKNMRTARRHGAIDVAQKSRGPRHRIQKVRRLGLVGIVGIGGMLAGGLAVIPAGGAFAATVGCDPTALVNAVIAAN